MLKSLKIENFRGFKSFELQQIGRINLLVGSNNSGKTSILEAIHLLYSRANLTSLKEQMLKRGEILVPEEQQEEYNLGAPNLFHNYLIREEDKLSIQGEDQDGFQVNFSINLTNESVSDSSYFIGKAERKDEEITSQVVSVENTSEVVKGSFPFLHFTWSELGLGHMVEVQLLPNYGIPQDKLKLYAKPIATHVYFIGSSSLAPYEMVETFNQVVLTPDEELVNEAINIIEPTVKRIAPIGMGGTKDRSVYSNFFVLRSDINQRVPLGNMGEGIWRMLGLALGLVNAKGGILLVDDIDTGLHFSTMVGMWKMIWETAKRLNVQIFATTHNSDCWTSLAEIARSQDTEADRITIQRIERGKPNSVIFNERQMAIAAERNIEIR